MALDSLRKPLRDAHRGWTCVWSERIFRLTTSSRSSGCCIRLCQSQKSQRKYARTSGRLMGRCVIEKKSGADLMPKVYSVSTRRSTERYWERKQRFRSQSSSDKHNPVNRLRGCDTKKNIAVFVHHSVSSPLCCY